MHVHCADEHSLSTIRTGQIVVNRDIRTASVDGQRIRLTRKEYAILGLLSVRKGSALSKEMLLNHLYGGTDEPKQKIIDVFVCKLRKKARPSDTRRALHRNRLGSRLCPARPSAGRNGHILPGKSRGRATTPLAQAQFPSSPRRARLQGKFLTDIAWE
jgi:Transcriptional regulatory protein, C terminal